MKSIFTVLLLFVLVSGALTQSKTEKLDKYLQLLEDNNKAMLCIAILEDGKLFYTNATGFATVDGSIKNTPVTKFRIGSVSKMFTSSIIFQLIEEGKLSLDTKLADFYPQVPNAEKISIAQLLGHRSGIYNFTDDKKYFEYYTAPTSHEELLKIISHYDPVFEPGEKYAYSNSNYILLGYIIEKISGSTYAGEIEKRITSKLNLENTYYGAKIGTSKNEAHSYKFKNKAWQLEPETDMSIPHGAGAMVSTAPDLAAFIDALFNHKIVSEESLEKMMQLRDGYGKGMMRFPFYERKAYGHEGGIDGFMSIVVCFSEDKVAFCALTNALNYNFNDILIGILSIYFEKPFELPDFSEKAASLSKEELAKYQGTYSSKALPLKITIKLKENQLFAQATGQNAFPLTAFSRAEFRFEQAGIIMKFAVEDNGVVRYNDFILNQGGGQFPYTRKVSKE